MFAQLNTYLETNFQLMTSWIHSSLLAMVTGSLAPPGFNSRDTIAPKFSSSI